MAEYFNYYTKIRSIKHIGFELQIIFDWGILGTVFIIYFIINNTHFQTPLLIHQKTNPHINHQLSIQNEN